MAEPAAKRAAAGVLVQKSGDLLKASEKYIVQQVRAIATEK